MRIIFIGPPGAGKGTQSVNLVRYLDIPHLSTGEMLRAAKESGSTLGQEAANHMDRGMLVPDYLIHELLGKRLEEEDCKKGFLLDGFPRTLSQAEQLDEFLRQHGTSLDVALAIEVSEDELVRRLSDRGREDDQPETIRRRLRGYEAETKPVLNYYRDQGLLQKVSGLGTMDEVFGRIQEVVDGITARRA